MYSKLFFSFRCPLKGGGEFLVKSLFHYENMFVLYTAIFHCCKKYYFHMEKYNIFLIFAKIIECGYTLEPPL